MGERKPKSEWQLQLRAIGEKYNVDFGMGDPELALAEAYELGRNSSKETLEHVLAGCIRKKSADVYDGRTRAFILFCMKAARERG